MTTLIQLRNEIQNSAGEVSSEVKSHYDSLVMGELSMLKSSGELIFDGMIGMNLCRKSEHLIPLIRESVDSHDDHFKMSVVENDFGFSVTIFLSLDDEFNKSLFCDLTFITGVEIDEASITLLECSQWIPKSDFDFYKQNYDFQKFEEKCLYPRALGMILN